MKVIVIGERGLAGSAFVRFCERNNYEVIKINRENYKEYIGTSADILVNANGNSSKVLAGKDPVGEIDRSIKSVMQTCVDFKFDKYILLSSADVYNDHSDPSSNLEETFIDIGKLSPYGLAKYLAELVVINRCSDHLILRLGGLLGPGLKKNPIFDLLTGDKIYVHPESKFGFIDTDSVARISLKLLLEKSISGVVNLCGEGLISIKDIMVILYKSDVDYPEQSNPIIYNISNEKVKKFIKIPSTQETVERFISLWNSNKGK